MGQSQGRESKEHGRTLSVPNPNLDPSTLPVVKKTEDQTQETSSEDQPDMYKVTQKQLTDIQIQIRQKIDEECKVKMMEGLTKAVEETEKKFIKYTGPRSPFANELQQKVHECYLENLRQPLKCSKIVRDFTETVERERRNAAFNRQS